MFLHDGPASRRIVLIANGTQAQTNGRLFAALAEKLSQRNIVAMHNRQLPRGVMAKLLYLVVPNARLLRNLLAADTLVLHSAAFLSLPLLLLARALGKHIVIFLWDDYTRPDAQGHVAAGLERAALNLADRILVPSGDYLGALATGGRPEISVFPLWPCEILCEPEPKPESDRLKLVFAGQINAIRGLRGALERLASVKNIAIEMHVFSGDPVPIGSAFRQLRFVEHGLVAPDELAVRLAVFDFGLVSLDPGFTGPAFPSKILTYIAAGLPVIYRGPELSAVTRLLEDGGLGLVLRDHDGKALVSRLAEIRAGFLHAQRDFYRESELNWTRLAAVF